MADNSSSNTPLLISQEFVTDNRTSGTTIPIFKDIMADNRTSGTQLPISQGSMAVNTTLGTQLPIVQDVMSDNSTLGTQIPIIQDSTADNSTLGTQLPLFQDVMTDNSSSGTQLILFQDFCGGIPFWDDATINNDSPSFSLCFIDTVLVWAPCAFIWIASPFLYLYIKKSRKFSPLPVSPLNLAKGATSFLCACLSVLQLIFQEHDGYACDVTAEVTSAAYTATALKFATFLLTIGVQQMMRLHGMKTSAIPFVFWLTLLGCELMPLYSHAQRESACSEDVVYYIYFALVCTQLILHCIAESYGGSAGYYEMGAENPCPDENASILSRITFEWLTPVVWKSYRRTFNEGEFWDQTPRLRCDRVGPRLEAAWTEEIDKCVALRHARVTSGMNFHFHNGDVTDAGPKGHLLGPKRRSGEKAPLIGNGNQGIPSYMRGVSESDEEVRRPNLYRAMFRVFIWIWAEATGYMVVGECMWLVQPIILRVIISMIENKGSHLDIEPEWKGYLYCVLLFIVLCINSFIYHIAFHHMMTLGLRTKTALICLIYKKALTMKRGGTKSTTVGEIVNLMSVDCQRIQDGFMFSFYIILIFFMIIIAGAQLWDLMGVASLGGIGVVLVVLPIVSFIATKQYKLQKELLDLKGNRIKILNEVIGGIKVLKMYAWEPSFMKKVQKIRSEEIRCLWKYATLAATSIVFAVHSPFMINFVLVLIYVLTSPTHTLGAEEAFTAISIINIMRFPIALCPFLVNGMVQAYVSIGRIQEYLWTEDINTENVQFVKEADNPVVIQNGEFTWAMDSQPVLKNINLEVQVGELVAVVGPVGSGKSSLVSACLGETERLRGQVKIKGSVAYVPQEAWIQNMTLRDNILFGKSYSEKKYNKVLSACALLPDLQILAGGDMTEIGEKGINISGGQKQRVSLARAVYNNADVYFMDDPLSAVDSHVGKHLFKNVIGNQGLLRHKTRVLVTHGVHWLPMVDRIIVLKDGQISEVGSYEELTSHDGAFAQFLQEYLQVEEQVEEDPEIERLKEAMRSKVEELRSDGGATSEEDSASGVRKRRRSTRSSVGSMSRSVSRQKSETKTLDVNDLSRLTLDEVSEEGSIKPTVLLKYVQAMGLFAVLVVFVTMSLFQGLNVFSNFWITYWTEDELLKNVSLSGTQDYEDRYLYYLLMYLLQGVMQGIFVFTSFYLALTRMVKASATLHDRMLTSILRSPMSFFDTTPIGRMMNRFSSDVDIMDNKLPESFRLWTIMLFSTVAVVIVVGVTTPIFIAAIVPVGIFYIFFVKFYLPTARQMRRTESVCRSPIFNHFSETITGASVIRAFRCGTRFIEESRKRVDKNIKFYYAANTGARWVGIRLEMIGNFVVLMATIFTLASDELNGAQVGLSTTYAVQITITLNLVVLAVSEMEMNVVSAERVTEYTTLPAEACWILKKDRPPSEWPSTGKIEFHSYMTRYREGLDLVLRGINCTIADGEKIGVVGRTGAGKSSLMLCLFRLIESAGGSILIDSVNIAKLGLHDLRTKLTILPQDPVLFSGSLRTNLDPFGRYNDESIWYALECAHLKTFVTNIEEGLAYECGEGGQNLSVGQRQLVCLARTLLHKTKVLILDEATAAVDMETDDLIQETIRTQFKDCTIISVAHRLNTILDYDRVMVLDAGLIKEFDSPQTLLQNTKGVFYGMAKDANIV